MKKLVRTGRIAALFLIVGVVLFIYITKMYQLQVIEGGSPVITAIDTITTTETIPAARGDILDRNGTVLVSSEPSYDIKLSRSILIEREDSNEILLALTAAAEEKNVSYTDTFPITKTAPFEYLNDMTDTQKSYLSQYLEYFGLEEDISASDLFVWLKDHYGIDYSIPIEDARTIIGLRYELEIRVVIGMDEYVFAEDVSPDFVSVLEEMNLPGVSVALSTTRVYNTEYGAHLLGYIGQMNAEEYEVYSEKGYSMNAYVGKTGVEQAFEEYLHGEDGLQRVTRSADTGAIVETEVISEASPGQNVYLSIDIGIQQTAERSLEENIAEMNNARGEEEEKISGGAVVVESVKDGQTLALASYPTYDLDSFFSDYTDLANDPDNPLFNRATMGTYNPGSVFKMVTAYAGLSAGIIDENTTVYDTGVYTKYPDYQPACWIYHTTGGGHGTVNLNRAIGVSCNYYFYSLGDSLGINAITNAAEKFGFGQSTGIEIGDASGVVASADYKNDVIGEQWYAADTLITAIGQGYSMFTPVQLANYTSTIANGGTINKMTLLNSVKSADYSETVYTQTAEILSQLNSGSDAEILSLLRQGMETVASEGTAASYFSDYGVKIACKTGTVESDASANTNGVFVCYAPADDPEIAISIVVEKASSGAMLMNIAKDILDYYFYGRVYDVNTTGENIFVP